MKGVKTLNNTGYIDLHVHSTVSDGKLSVQDIIALAQCSNVRTIAFAEHYNMGSYKIAKELAANSLEVIPAVEIGASLANFGMSKNHVCHILAYYPSYKICDVLDEYENSRDVCVKKTLKKLQKSISLSYHDVVRYARNKKSIGRFDIAIALYKKGYAKSPVSAYGQFLELGKAFYVERKKLDVVSLIQKIRESNGVPIIAHPKSLKLNFNNMLDLLHTLKDSGLEGLEVYNPCNSQEYRQHLLELCNFLDLLPTCGSDFHGIADRGIYLGAGINNNLRITDYTIIQNLKNRQHRIWLENRK